MSEVNGEKWDQRLSLAPPPYEGALKPYLQGLEVGDPFVDNLPTSQLLCHGKQINSDSLKVDESVPSWVDWDQVERGQKLWFKHLGRSYFALGQALVIGFSIARFAVVLTYSGYAQSAKTALERYRSETGFAVIDWFRYPLNDPKSEGRKQIHRVRLMHAFARRKTSKLFDKEKHEGIALSQYDMAEVLIGFSAVVLHFLSEEFEILLSIQEKKDMVACWRIIGYYLGIQDEYNVCRSLEHLEACFEDYMAHTPQRIKTSRECTKRLQETAVEGFGMGSGLGSEAWWGILSFTLENQGFLPEYLPHHAINGMSVIGYLLQKMMKLEFINRTATKELIRQREEWQKAPKDAERKLYVLSYLASFHDKIIWKVYSFVFTIKRIILLVFLLRWLVLLRKRIPTFHKYLTRLRQENT